MVTRDSVGSAIIIGVPRRASFEPGTIRFSTITTLLLGVVYRPQPPMQGLFRKFF